MNTNHDDGQRFLSRKASPMLVAAATRMVGRSQRVGSRASPRPRGWSFARRKRHSSSCPAEIPMRRSAMTSSPAGWEA